MFLFPPHAPPKNYKLQNFHPNATLHHKQFSKPQINKTQNSATFYSSFPQWHSHIIQGACHRSQGFRRPLTTKSRIQSQTIGCGICAEQKAKWYVLNNFRTVPIRKVLLNIFQLQNSVTLNTESVKHNL